MCEAFWARPTGPTFPSWLGKAGPNCCCGCCLLVLLFLVKVLLFLLPPGLAVLMIKPPPPKLLPHDVQFGSKLAPRVQSPPEER